MVITNIDQLNYNRFYLGGKDLCHIIYIIIIAKRIYKTIIMHACMHIYGDNSMSHYTGLAYTCMYAELPSDQDRGSI